MALVYGDQVDDPSQPEQKARLSNRDDPTTQPDSDDEPVSAEVGVATTGSTPQTVAKDVSAKKLIERIKKTPEVISLLSALVDDIMGRGFEFEYVARSDTSGERKVQEARQFVEQSGFKQELEAALMDMLAVGDGYLFRRRLTESEIKNAIASYVDANGDFNDEEMKSVAASYAMKSIDPEDEGLLSTKDVRAVAARTVEHDINEYGDILEYIQKVGGNEQHLDPDKIVHLPLMNFDGRTYGFTPMQALLSETSILANIKDTHGVFFSNAAVPNKVWKLQNSGPNSDAYKTLVQNLKRYRRLPDKHKDLILTGDIEVEDLNLLDDEMEFRNLAEYITRVLVMSWGVPPTRVGVAVGADNSSREATLSHEGYFLRIERLQDKIANILTQELFLEEFGVKATLKSPSTRRNLREAETDLKETEAVKQKLALGLISRSEALKRLGIKEWEAPDLGEMSETDIMQMARDTSSNQNLMMTRQEGGETNADAGTNAERRSSAQN